MNTYLTTMSISLCLSVAFSGATPTASELLERYAQTQDQLKSFILKSEDEFTAEYDLRFLPNQGERGRGAGGYLGEVRSDGTRHYRSEKLWEKRRAYLPATKSAAQSDPRYNSYLWDGKRVFQYQRSNKTAANDRLFLTPEAHEEARGEHIISTNRSRVLLGYFEDTFDRAPYNFRRIDNELKQAARLEVLQATEPVRGSQCRVIVAQTAESRYKLWIDPQHSFHIAKAEITRGGRDVKFGNREEISLHTYLKNVRFQKFGNVWMPVEADWGYQTKFINNCFSRADYHHKIVEFTLSPDHELLRSFDTDEIRNGTSVLIIGHKDGSYIWQDGRVVDNEGLSVLDSRIGSSIAVAQLRPAARTPDNPAAAELLDKYAQTQDKFQSCIIKTESSSQFSLQTLGRRRRIDEICEVRYDGTQEQGNRVKPCKLMWGQVGTKQVPKEEPVYTSWTWDGQNYMRYSGAPKENARLDVCPGRVRPYMSGAGEIANGSLTSRMFGTALTGYLGSIEEKGVIAAVLHCSKTDPGIADTWGRAEKIRLPIGKIQDVAPEVLRAWRIETLPHLILTNTDHVITAEGFGVGQLNEKIGETRSAAD